MAPEYCNVDLDILSRVRLDSIVEYFEASGAMVLAHGKLGPGKFFARIESTSETTTPTRQLSQLCRLLAKVPPALQPQLAKSSLTMDVGIASGISNPVLQFSIPPPLLRRIHALSVTLAFTIYPMTAERTL